MDAEERTEMFRILSACIVILIILLLGIGGTVLIYLILIPPIPSIDDEMDIKTDFCTKNDSNDVNVPQSSTSQMTYLVAKYASLKNEEKTFYNFIKLLSRYPDLHSQTFTENWNLYKVLQSQSQST